MNQSIVQQFTMEGNIRSRVRKASPKGDMQRTMWMFALTRLMYCGGQMHEVATRRRRSASDEKPTTLGTATRTLHSFSLSGPSFLTAGHTVKASAESRLNKSNSQDRSYSLTTHPSRLSKCLSPPRLLSLSPRCYFQPWIIQGVSSKQPADEEHGPPSLLTCANTLSLVGAIRF